MARQDGDGRDDLPTLADLVAPAGGRGGRETLAATSDGVVPSSSQDPPGATDAGAIDLPTR